MQRAARFINQHLFSPKLTVSWIKDQLRITNNNFSSRFAYHFGKTPKQFILYHRVEVSKKLMAKDEFENVPVSEIGYMVGFRTQSAFSRIFKRKTGKTPRHWPT